MGELSCMNIGSMLDYTIATLALYFSLLIQPCRSYDTLDRAKDVTY